MASLLAPSSPFDRPSLVFIILTQPVKLLLHLITFVLDHFRTIAKPAQPPIRIVCVSDTHSEIPEDLPSGDLLIHAGDLTNAGTIDALQDQIDWLDSLPFEHVIAIAGNHDLYLDPRSRRTLPSPDSSVSPRALDWKRVKYLQHSSISLSFSSQNRTLKIYGAPQVPACGGDGVAFTYPRGTDAWSGTIPTDIDVLITHTPPKYHLDLPCALGCEWLLREVWRVKPKLHVFGHIHCGKTDLVGSLRGGQEIVRWNEKQRRLEKAFAREDGFLRQVLDPRSWTDVFLAVAYGVLDISWDIGWGGTIPPATTMINAAMVYENTGKIGHDAQVIDI